MSSSSRRRAGSPSHSDPSLIALPDRSASESSPQEPPGPSESPGEERRVLAERYLLLRLIGKGGMGAVYEAEHTGLGLRVAIKLLSENFAGDRQAISRFHREARAAAAINHPNVVAVTDNGTHQGVPFLVMELAQGQSLSALLRQRRILLYSEAIDITCQVLAGLSAAHGRGVIHRDLKPGNILVGAANPETGRRPVKILDFGVSKFYLELSGDLTAVGSIVGTPRFMAPEQARGHKDLDGRVDIYAVGVLLFRMVTGRLPIAGGGNEHVLRRLLEGPVPRPRDIRPDLPIVLEEVILRAMAHNRQERYPTAAAFAAAVEEAAQALGISCPSVGAESSSVGENSASSSTPLGASAPAASVPNGSAVDLSADTEVRPRPSRPGWRRRLLWSLPPLAALVLSASAYLADWPAGFWPRPKPLRFGITRYLPREQLRREYRPMIDYLSDALGRRVELYIADDYVDLSAKLREGRLQLAALSACDYVRATRRHDGLSLLATYVSKAGRTYQGYILTRADSGFNQLEDLRGKAFCYVTPKSCSGYLYPRAQFRRKGIDPDRAFTEIRFTGDHMRALSYLVAGECDGAAVFAGILDRLDQVSVRREDIRVIAATGQIPYDAYCVPESLPARLRKKLKKALLALSPGSKAVRQALGPTSRISGFVPATNARYDPVRRIERYLDGDAAE